MHLMLGATGIINDMVQWEDFLKTIPMALPYKNDDGTEGSALINFQLRPIRFYDCIFPRGELHKVLNTIKPETEIKSKNCSLSDMYKWVLQKGLKLNEIPAPDPAAGRLPFPQLNVRVVGIGVRDDADIHFKEVGRTHEGL